MRWISKGVNFLSTTKTVILNAIQYHTSYFFHIDLPFRLNLIAIKYYGNFPAQIGRNWENWTFDLILVFSGCFCPYGTKTTSLR